MFRFAAGIERIANLLDETDIDRFLKIEKKIKIGLVPIITKACSEEKKMQIKLKLFEIMKKFEGAFVFEFLAGDKKPEKQFEYLEKVKNFSLGRMIFKMRYRKNLTLHS